MVFGRLKPPFCLRGRVFIFLNYDSVPLILHSESAMGATLQRIFEFSNSPKNTENLEVRTKAILICPQRPRRKSQNS